MKECPRCGNLCKDSDKFCMECGESLANAVSGVNEEHREDIKQEQNNILNEINDTDQPEEEENESFDSEIDTTYFTSNREEENIYEPIDTSIYEKENKITIKSKEQEKKVFKILIAAGVVAFLILVAAVVFVVLSKRDSNFIKFSENWQEINACIVYISQRLQP